MPPRKAVAKELPSSNVGMYGVSLRARSTRNWQTLTIQKLGQLFMNQTKFQRQEEKLVCDAGHVKPNANGSRMSVKLVYPVDLRPTVPRPANRLALPKVLHAEPIPILATSQTLLWCKTSRFVLPMWRNWRLLYLESEPIQNQHQVTHNQVWLVVASAHRSPSKILVPKTLQVEGPQPWQAQCWN